MNEKYITATFEFDNIKTYLFDETTGVVGQKETLTVNNDGRILEFEFPKQNYFKIIREMLSNEEKEIRDRKTHMVDVA